MDCVFRPGLHACDVAGTLVFLDLPADRYFALSPRVSAACLRLARNELSVAGDEEVQAMLLRDGIVQAGPPGARPHLCRATASTIPLTSSQLDGSVSATTEALSRQVFSRIELRVRPLAKILGQVGQGKQRSTANSDHLRIATKVAAAFARADRWLTPLGFCLSRSIAFSRTLTASNVAHDLMIGVKLRPFEAHCWIEVAGHLASDNPGTIAPFTPILVL